MPNKADFAATHRAKPCNNTYVKPPARTLMRSLARTKQKALGQSCQSLGQSCARPAVAREDAELALERSGEIRDIVEADRVGNFPGHCAGLGTIKNGSYRAFSW